MPIMSATTVNSGSVTSSAMRRGATSLRTVVFERRISLQCEHAAREETCEDDDGERADADHVGLRDHLVEVGGAAEEPARGARHEQAGFLNFEQRADGDVHEQAIRQTRLDVPP